VTVGRPTKYKAEYVKQAKKLCSLGATMANLADFFDVHIDTIYAWMSTHKPFSESIKVGKAPSDDRVEMSLYHRATGYSHPEEVIKVVGGEVVRIKTMKYYPPDSTACIYWTRNRRPDRWRQNPSEGGSSGDFVDMVSKLIDKLPG